MPRFRKKPILIEAKRLNASTTAEAGSLDPNTRAHAEIAGWMYGNGFADFRVTGDRAPFGLAIETLEGTMIAEPGDWIIREPFAMDGRKFYPCKPRIFEATYEPADV